jgi:hypothetical protein
MARPPSVADANVISHLNEKEGIQRRKVESTSTSSNLPASPTSEEEARVAVVDYLTTFDREHLTAEQFELAVAAEMETRGSGRAVVKAASQKAWLLKREGVARE